MRHDAIRSGAAGCVSSTATTAHGASQNRVGYETPFRASNQCSVKFLNPAQFDANSTANPSIEMPPVVTPLRQRGR